jgi:hypothetical protein
MMITNYATLISEVVDELDRDDLEGKLPRYIAEVEADLGRRLRVLDMETTTTLAASSELVSLPAGFLSMRHIHVEGTPDLALSEISLANLIARYDGSEGFPEAYALTGGKLKLAPPPEEPLNLYVTYLAKFTGLSESNATNWLITNHPDIYARGVVALACFYSRDFEGFNANWGLYEAKVKDLKEARAKDRFAGPLVPSLGVRHVSGVQA